MTSTKIAPIHPGELLRDDFIAENDIGANHLALELHVPSSRIAEIIAGRRVITAETALRLARYFGTTAEFWINLQTHYDLEVAEDAKAEAIEREVRPIPRLENAKRRRGVTLSGASADSDSKRPLFYRTSTPLVPGREPVEVRRRNDGGT